MVDFSQRHDSKTLILIRHGEADWGLDDYNRPLTERGHRQAAQAGKWLLEQGVVPQMMVSSAALRTRQTTTWVSDSLGEKAPTASLDERLYLCPPSALMTAINNVPPAVDSLMLVGHNPGIEDAAAQLMRQDSAYEAAMEISYGFAPASVAVFEVLGQWDELVAGEAKLVAFRGFDG